MSDEDREYFRGLVGFEPAAGGGSGGSALTNCDAPGEVFMKLGPDGQVAGCAQSACHDSATAQSGLDLAVADPFPALLDKPADMASLLSACQGSGLLVIDSFRPEQSMLYTKMFRTDDPAQTLRFTGCGVSMPYPFGPKAVDAWERDCVLSWIRSKLEAGLPPIEEDAGAEAGAGDTGTEDAGVDPDAAGDDDAGDAAGPSSGEPDADSPGAAGGTF